MSEDARKNNNPDKHQTKKTPFMKNRVRHIQSQVFILVLFLPSLVILLALLYILFFHFSKVHEESEQLVEKAVPSILSAQRNFIYINNLKNIVSFVHSSSDQRDLDGFYAEGEVLLKEISENISFGKDSLSAVEDDFVMFKKTRQHLDLVISEYASSLNHLAEKAVFLEGGDTFLAGVIMNSVQQFLHSPAYTEGADINKTLRALHLFSFEKCGQGVKKVGAMQEYCTQFDNNLRRFLAVRSDYLESLTRFNQVYEGLCVYLDSLIEVGSRYESDQLKDHLVSIADNTRQSESVIYFIFFIVIVSCCVAYLLILRLISRPLQDIAQTIRRFLLHRRKPKFLMHSPVSEIAAIYNVFSLVFDNISEQDKMLADQYRDYKKLLNISYKDELTGVKNRRALDDLIEKLDVVPSDIAVLMVDIDNFKRFNDTKDHQYGDFVLGTIGRQLRASVANEDCVYRYGGEEFLIILQEVGERVLVDIGKRLCKVVYDLGIENSANSTGFLTISVGLSKSTQKDGQYTMPELIAQADEALYNAKNSGRNRVVSYYEIEQKSGLLKHGSQKHMESLNRSDC